MTAPKAKQAPNVERDNDDPQDERDFVPGERDKKRATKHQVHAEWCSEGEPEGDSMKWGFVEQSNPPEVNALKDAIAAKHEIVSGSTNVLRGLTELYPLVVVSGDSALIESFSRLSTAFATFDQDAKAR